jgi:hypothetical protein
MKPPGGLSLAKPATAIRRQPRGRDDCRRHRNTSAYRQSLPRRSARPAR